MTFSIVPVYGPPLPLSEMRVSVVGYADKAELNEVARSLAQVDPAGGAASTGKASKAYMRIAAMLDRYVRDAAPGEDRLTARRRVEAAMVDGKRDAMLDLKNLGLLELPPVLPAVDRMDFSGNRLSALPPLPCDVKVLLLGRNRFKKLPDILPGRLTQLDVSHNYLTELSEHLPNSLVHLDARDNGLRHVPKRLPNALRVFRVDRNRADLREIAAARVASMTGRRAFNHVMAGAGMTTARAIERADTRRCYLALDAQAVVIELARRQPPPSVAWRLEEPALEQPALEQPAIEATGV